MKASISLIVRPDASGSLEALAEKALRQAGAVGVLPTPIDDLIASAQLQATQDPEPFVRRFVERLAGSAREAFQAAMQKVRGIADLRERAIYVSGATGERRKIFVKAHELGHQVIPWQQLNVGYRDDDLSLSPDAQELFDQEANFFAAEVIFQGRRFRRRVRDYRSSFDAAFLLAEEHGASRHATLWRYVEEQDEAVALLSYWPSRYTLDSAGYPVLRGGKVIGSPSFLTRYASAIDSLKREIGSDHPWAVARDGNIGRGDIQLPCDGSPARFEWESWWNGYSLLVLLRRRPLLAVVKRN